MRVALQRTRDRGRMLSLDEHQRWLALVCVVSASVMGCAPGRSGDPIRGTGGSVGAGGLDGTSQSGGAGGESPSGTTGGTTSTGGSTAIGGATGGGVGAGGATSTGGVSGRGGAGASGGMTGAGGTTGAGGVSSAGGSQGMGGTAGAGSAGPCDIYQSANTPCVAAHSTVRALYASYSGNLYQVRKSDGTTKDIPLLAPGGFANSSVQDSFCSGTTCTISIIYDQSPQGNHLKVSPPVYWLANGGKESNATAAKISVDGHMVYGVYVPAGGTGAYRNNSATGLATADAPEAMYMVADGKHQNGTCCFDYGNAETSGKDDGNATMECVYFGSSTQWAKGNGNGPWVLADLENGVFHGGDPNMAPASNTPINVSYVTAMLKGPSGNRFVLKAGDAQSGALITKYDGSRPPGYSPQKKQGAIVLGTGGDGSDGGIGTFFEGCITKGLPSDAADDAVQANIVAARYGR